MSWRPFQAHWGLHPTWLSPGNQISPPTSCKKDLWMKCNALSFNAYSRRNGQKAYVRTGQVIFLILQRVSHNSYQAVICTSWKDLNPLHFIYYGMTDFSVHKACTTLEITLVLSLCCSFLLSQWSVSTLSRWCYEMSLHHLSGKNSCCTTDFPTVSRHLTDCSYIFAWGGCFVKRLSTKYSGVY